MTTSTLRIGDDTFTYTDVGAGPVVVFVHGALGDRRTWQPHVDALAPRARCVAYTQRWFGTDAWRADGPAFGVATHARDLIAFVDALAVAPVALVGWSYAGHVIFDALRARPDLFRAALIYEPGVPSYVDDPDELAAFRADADAMFVPIFRAAHKRDLALATRRLIDGAGGHDGYFDAQPPARRAIELDNAASLARLLAQEPPPQITADDLRALTVPVSIAWGARSRPAFAIPARAAARALPRARHVELPEAGHMFPDEDPAGFAALIAEWLDGRERFADDIARAITPDVVAELVANHREFLRFVERRVGDRALAEDILQDAFVRSLDKLDTIRESAIGWFYRVLRNALIDRQRHAAVAARRLDAYAQEVDVIDDPELHRAVCQCVAQLADTLKPEYAHALRRIEIDGLSVGDFATEAGITASNAGVRVFRARAALERQVARACGTCADHGCLDCTCAASPRPHR